MASRDDPIGRGLWCRTLEHARLKVVSPKPLLRKAIHLSKNTSTWIMPAVLISLALVIIVFSSYQASVRNLSPLELFLFQSFIFVFSLLGSFYIGRMNARTLGRELLGTSSRSAFRRLLSTYQGLRNAATTIDEGLSGRADSDQSLKVLRAIIEYQILSIDDAMEDWADIVPDEVKKLRETMVVPNASSTDQQPTGRLHDG